MSEPTGTLTIDLDDEDAIQQLKKQVLIQSRPKKDEHGIAPFRHVLVALVKDDERPLPEEIRGKVWVSGFSLMGRDENFDRGLADDLQRFRTSEDGPVLVELVTS